MSTAKKPGTIQRLKRSMRRIRIIQTARDIQQSIHQRLVSAPNPHAQVISLEAINEPLGSVLLSFVIDPFLHGKSKTVSYHTHDWESLQMAQTFVELGYRVDVISFLNNTFVPEREYVALIDCRRNLERLRPLVGPECIKIAHLDTAHILFHDAAELGRLVALQQRRGVTLEPRRYEHPNAAIENADCATVLGNEFTIGTYSYAGKPIYRIPISTLAQYPWDEAKDFDSCRRRFLWLNSGGFVHKGLDLVLEAFASMPDYHLTVCGPIHSEKDFETTYYKELYQTPNIHALGWIDVTSPEFTSLCSQTIGAISASCSEGCSGSVINCMHAGLIPIVNYETGVDVSPEYGVLMESSTISEIKQSIQRLAAMPPASLRQMARVTWEFVRANHTRERFASCYRQVMTEVLRSKQETKQEMHVPRWVGTSPVG